MTNSSLPKVSIIIACYQAHAFVTDAVQCALAQTYLNIEVIVAPDDGDNYAFLHEQFPSSALKILPPHSKPQTGAGATRNRAIDAATGDFFAILDADDLIPADYIEQLIGVAELEGIAVCPVSYVLWETHEVIRSPVIDGNRLDLRGFGKLLCSMHPMVHRSLEPGFPDGFAQDVVRDGLVIAKAGRISVVKDTLYRLRIRPGSACNAGGKSERAIQRAYARRREQILTQPTELGVHVLSLKSRIEFAELFDFRAFVSHKFSGSGADCYNTWIASYEETLWQAFMVDQALTCNRNSEA